MSALLLPALPRASAPLLRDALDHVIEAALSQAGASGVRALSGRLPSKQSLLDGQRALRAAPDSNDARAQRALLECALIVASADELTPEEQTALERLFQQVLGDAEAAQLIQELQRHLEVEGVQGSLSRVADQLVSFEQREQALSFAVLAAIADRELGEAEADRLLDLGARFGFGVGEVQRLVDRMAKALKNALASSNLSG
ncbi:MAG: TerB family tellurite resistance protein [Polyangiaceae bacterium]|nr:TerB family tellurite resistance protein [Myxococcales bacterium]MCB9587083.1 TerB family tellurite resistance protein [Polyangiaceae bacterium]MCB9609542.1 TerB family tellurite resistance protein [Polyangiaceae bacterium]